MQIIDLGTPPAGRDGVRAREAFEAVNANFAELDQRAAQAQSTADTASQASTQNTQSIAHLETVKVDKVTGQGLSSNDFTDAEKEKLAGLESSKFQGVFISLSELEAAVPAGEPGFYAFVDAGIASPTQLAIWDDTDSEWQLFSSGGLMTPAQVKAAYEANPDTNAFTDAQVAKLGGIAPGAQVNATAATQAEAEAGTGTALRSWTAQRVWQSVAAWWASSAMKAKLDGIAAGATANDSDVNLRKRSTHTGEQGIDTITGLDVALGGKLTNPMTTAGDVIVGGASGAPIRLAKGAVGQVFTIDPETGLPVWANPEFVSVDYLVVGGGGSGGAAFAGGHAGGGGGGGGVLSGSTVLRAGISLPVVVGSGGAAVAFATTARGNRGGDSGFNGLTAPGGGGGAGSAAGAGNLSATTGGPGGGGNVYNPTGAPPTTQGYAGGSGGGTVGSSGVAGGGGGSGSAGGNSSTLQSGSGGSGTASSISGTVKTYGGGGGGGGGWTGQTILSGAGGAGGGGSGGGSAGNSNVGASGQAGAPNTGGGGGGHNGGANSGASGAGGSGVVIVRYRGAPRAAGGTITQVDGFTIHTFTGSGNFEVSV